MCPVEEPTAHQGDGRGDQEAHIIASVDQDPHLQRYQVPI